MAEEFKKHRTTLRRLQRRNNRYLWEWDITPVSFRRYIEAVRGGYIGAMRRSEDPEKIKSYRRIIELIETRVRPRIIEFHNRLELLRAAKITEDNIMESKQLLLILKEDEISYVEHFRRYLVGGLPGATRFMDRLDYFKERFGTIVESLEKLIKAELHRLANIRYYCVRVSRGTTHTPDRILEVSGYFLTRESKEKIFDKAKSMVNEFLKSLKYDFIVNILSRGKRTAIEEEKFDYEVVGKVAMTEEWTIKVGLAMSKTKRDIDKYLVDDKSRYTFQLTDYKYNAIRGRCKFTAKIDETLKELIRLIKVNTRRGGG